MLERIYHLGYAVHDIEAATRFYVKTFGVQPSEPEAVEEQGIVATMFRVGESQIENGEPADKVGCVRAFSLRNGDRLRARLQAARPTFVQATPSTWRMLVHAGWPGAPDLTVLCGGEPLPEDLARDLTARARAVWNLYGPTETTVWSMAEPLAGQQLGQRRARRLRPSGTGWRSARTTGNRCAGSRNHCRVRRRPSTSARRAASPRA